MKVNFEKRWISITHGLSKKKLDDASALQIYFDFQNEVKVNNLFHKEQELSYTRLVQLQNDLNHALDEAKLRYKKEKQKNSLIHKLVENVKQISISISNHFGK